MGFGTLTMQVEQRTMAKQDTYSRRLTYEDYRLFPEDGLRHEIIDGEHDVTPAPFLKHQGVSINISSEMRGFVKKHRLGVVFTAPCDVILAPNSVVQPDIIFVSAARVGILTKANIQGAPDLVVEIISDSTRRKDEVTKRELYERFGVKEYWLFDPEIETARVFRRTQNGLVLLAELSKAAGDRITTELLPGFTLPMAEIFDWPES